MVDQTKQGSGTTLHLMHRMPALPGASLHAALDQCRLALGAGFDGCFLPVGADPADTLALDGFSLAALLAQAAPRGRIALADLSLSILPPDEILRRSMVLAAVAPGRLALGLSLGRPYDLRAANVHCGRARRDFPLRLSAMLQALGGAPDPAVSVDPAFRALPGWPEALPRPEIFISGTYSAENRTAAQRHNLPWLTYGDPFDEDLRKSLPVHDLVLRVDLVGGEAGDRYPVKQYGAPPGYHDAEEYRTRLQAAPHEILRGTVAAVARRAKELAGTSGVRRLILDPAIEGLDAQAVTENFAAVTGQLLPALRG